MEPDRIVFKDRQLILRGKTLLFPFRLAELVAILGPCDRQWKRENILSTWDQAGIVVYEEFPNAPVISLSLSFQAKDHPFSPTCPFSGTIRFGGVELSAQSICEDLIAAGLQQDGLLPFLYIADIDELEIIAEYRDGLTDFSINK